MENWVPAQGAYQLLGVTQLLGSSLHNIILNSFGLWSLFHLSRQYLLRHCFKEKKKDILRAYVVNWVKECDESNSPTHRM